VIDVVDPPHQFVTRTVPEPSEAPHVTVWTLKDENRGTRLTITHTGYELEPDDVRHSNMEQNAFGFGMVLANIKAHIEGGDLLNPGGF
jgi:activator of Hsp90 ATPase-like protein